MICPICRQAEPEPGTATLTLERGQATFVMKDVPAHVCPNCREEYISEDISVQVLAVAEEAFRAGVTLDVRRFAGVA